MTDTYAGTYRIIGPPGTGKTTWLSAQVRKIVDEAGRLPTEAPVLICSLTRTAAAEVAGRDLPLPADAVGTLHAHCFRALDRPRVTAGEILRDWNDRHPDYVVSATGFDAGVELGADGAIGDRLAERYHLLRHQMVARDQWIEFAPSVVGFADAWEEWKTSAEAYDFTDLIEGVLGQDIPPPFDPDVIIVDEAQDLSELEYRTLMRWGEIAGALMIVGDPMQSLYTWRGAHPELFSDGPPDRLRVLRQSYRVPRRVRDLAVRWALEAVDDLPEYLPRVDRDTGEVVDGDVVDLSLSYRSHDALIDMALDATRERRSIMFAASCSFIVDGFVKSLRRAGIPFSNPWRVTRGDWNPWASGKMRGRIASFLRLLDHGNPWTWAQIADWSKPLKASGVIIRGQRKVLDETLAKDKRQQPLTMIEMRNVLEPAFLEAALSDGIDANRALALYANHVKTESKSSLGYVRSVIDRFGPDVLDRDACVHVGTIHSFKGAEADDVVLFPDLSPRAARNWEGANPEKRAAIVRTFYVGITRARDRLYLCNPGSPRRSVPLKRTANIIGL